MSVLIACLIWLLWPLFAFGGGLGFVPLASLAGLLMIPKALPALRFRAYMAPLVVFLVYAAVSALWSPRPFALVEIGPGAGDFHIRSDVLRVGTMLAALALVMAAATRFSDMGRAIIHRFAMGAFLVHLVICAVLAVFEDQMLDLFAPMMASRADGVQNIVRNNMILAMAAPFLVLGLTEGRSRVEAMSLAAVFILGIGAIFLFQRIDGGVFTLALAGGAMAVVSIWPRSGFRILGVGVAAVILFMPVLTYLIAGGTEPEDVTGSITWRLAIWDRTLDEILEHPLFGAGNGVLRTIDETLPTGALEGYRLVPNHAHNMPLQLWAETGAVGAVLAAAAALLAGWRMPAPAELGRNALRAAALVGVMTAVGCVAYDLWNAWWWGVSGLLAMLVIVAPKADVNRSRTAPGQPEGPVLKALGG